MLTVIQNLLLGMALAIGKCVPGISMATVAIISGIYNEIIDFFFQLTELLKAALLFIFAKKSKIEVGQYFRAVSWSFGVPIIIGISLTIFVLARFIPDLTITYPSQMAAIAFGIVFASLFIPLNEIKQKTGKEILVITVTFIAFWFIFGLASQKAAFEPPLVMYIIGGIVASAAIFLPAIGITTVLTISGIYEPLTRSLNAFGAAENSLYAFSAVFLFILGFIIGVLALIRGLALVIDRYKSLFLAFTVGLIAATLQLLWPFTINGSPVTPWELTLTQFTQQILIIGVSFVVVSVVRKISESSSTKATSFGNIQRTVITS
jgi:putative membrane protein